MKDALQSEEPGAAKPSLKLSLWKGTILNSLCL
jgi:hypothetical protein